MNNAATPYGRFTEVGTATNIHAVDVAGEADDSSAYSSLRPREFARYYLLTSEILARQAESSSTSDPADTTHFSAGKTGDETFNRGRGDFAALDELRTPEGRIQRQIDSFRASSSLRFRERLAHRLTFLLNAVREEGEDWHQHSSESLRNMLLFLEAALDYRYPTVTVTPSATFRAQWTSSPAAHLALDFLPDGQVRFVVFSPDPRHPDRVQRVNGITSRENVIRAVEPYKVRRWTVDAGL